MLGKSLSNQGTRYFSAIAKKARMELTVRTPYRTIVANFDGFSRVTARTNEAVLSIQNKSPAATYVLPPGLLKIKFTEQRTDTSGEIFHCGGWAVIHPDNSCEITLADGWEKEEMAFDQLDTNEMETISDPLVDKFVGRIRSRAQKTFLKKAT